MGHLLVVESWVGAMSGLLPRAIREGGHRFTFLTRDLHHYLRATPPGTVHPLLAADNVLTTETNDVPALLTHVAKLHETLAFDGVLTSCDYYLGTVARIAERLGLPGAAPGAVERAYRKDLARQALRRAGVPGPAFAVAQGWAETLDAAEEIGYPLVVKPVDLCAGMHVRRVDDRAGLRAAFDALAGFPVNARRQPRVPLVLLEELLTGPEVSVETVTVPAAATGSVTTVVGVTGKRLAGAPWFVESGHLFPADLPAETSRAAAETAVAALAAVGLDRGVAHTELRLTPAGPRVIEINPRPAGNQITELVRRVTGIDLPMVYAQLALGERPDLTPTDTGVRSAAISFLLPPRAGTVAGITGTDRLTDDPRVVDHSVKPAGHRTGDASSNNEYLGHVSTVDTTGAGALAAAEELVSGLAVRYADELTGAPA
ncbi:MULTISPECIES: ATP-grasp domain-containing protein [Micromonospora]|uniref:Argininosuccinate lyase n=1 Tax=Micromonospora yangpuensis TaxID=683228 RepID=A0A1C6U160_9ACTN|nr:ATP-grasp domain-containing protein [Micromonospora yangpuensis]GGM11168.1 argininosuccinate lyase [Micromonospora yangpuensis]SCL47805.1 argininosuccinate lyase [Micromonospora yangpuensis]